MIICSALARSRKRIGKYLEQSRYIQSWNPICTNRLNPKKKNDMSIAWIISYDMGIIDNRYTKERSMKNMHGGRGPHEGPSTATRVPLWVGIRSMHWNKNSQVSTYNSWMQIMNYKYECSAQAADNSQYADVFNYCTNEKSRTGLRESRWAHEEV